MEPRSGKQNVFLLMTIRVLMTTVTVLSSFRFSILLVLLVSFNFKAKV